MEKNLFYAFSPVPLILKAAEQDPAGQGQSYPHSTCLTKTSLIPLPASTLCPIINQAPDHYSSSVSYASPQPNGSTFQGAAS